MGGRWASTAPKRCLVIAVGLVLSGQALPCCRNYTEFANQCESQGGVPSPNPPTCNPRISSPPIGNSQNETNNLEAEAAARAASDAAVKAEQRRLQSERDAKEKANKDAAFIRSRDEATRNLRGNVGTSVGSNSSGRTELRGTQVDTGIRDLRPERLTRGLGGREAAWKQLHCAASIMAPAIAALKIDGTSKGDFVEFRYLADEALNALNGQKLGVVCAEAPPMREPPGVEVNLMNALEKQKGVLTKIRALGTKIEDARQKQEDAQTKLDIIQTSKPDSGVLGVVERQRQINQARNNAGNEVAKAQREFNEGKRSEESAKKELIKIDEKVQAVVRNELMTWDETPPDGSKVKKP